MNLPIYQIDAFCDRVFKGNPAAVCPLDSWLDDATLQAIAAENNLSETAFFVACDGGYEIRWFTPITEVSLCGHATLACAFVIDTELEPLTDSLTFFSKSGPLFVEKSGNTYQLNFPARSLQPCSIEQSLIDGLGATPLEVFASEDCIAVFEDEQSILALKPNFQLLLKSPYRGIIATAPCHNPDVDFVSRFFAPRVGINEDPVTGSAHCALTPYWANKLGKNTLLAHQRSKRGGVLQCTLSGDRVLLSGQAVKYLEGKLYI